MVVEARPELQQTTLPTPPVHYHACRRSVRIELPRATDSHKLVAQASSRLRKISNISGWSIAALMRMREPNCVVVGRKFTQELLPPILCVRGPYYEYNGRGYAVLPGVDIRCHAC